MVKGNASRIICILLMLSVFAFVCDSDRTEQGRFVRGVRNVITNDNEALTAVSVPKPNTDALAESRGTHTSLAEFRLTGRQVKRPARTSDITLFIILIIAGLVSSTGLHRHYFCNIVSCDAVILAYMMRQDGKK